MKIKDVVKEASKELAEDDNKRIKGVVKNSLKRIREAKITLKRLEEQHNEMLEKDVDEFLADLPETSCITSDNSVCGY